MHASTICDITDFGTQFEPNSSFLDADGEEIFYGGGMPDGFHVTTLPKTRRGESSMNPFAAELEYDADAEYANLAHMHTSVMRELSGRHFAASLLFETKRGDGTTDKGVYAMLDDAAESPWRQMRIVARFVTGVHAMRDDAVGDSRTVKLLEQRICSKVNDADASVRSEARRLVKRLARDLHAGEITRESAAYPAAKVLNEALASFKTVKPSRGRRKAK